VHRKRHLISLLVCLLAPQISWGLIVLDSRTSTNNAFNTAAPTNGSPWSNVAQQERLVSGSPIVDSSAVYIGNGYVLTAAHTYGPTSVILDGVGYSVDTSFSAISFTPLDVRLYKILNPPALPLIPLPDAADGDLGTTCTMIGWGKGKGAIVTDKGWQWGDDSTKAKRWGTNTTQSTTMQLSYLAYSYNATYTLFNAGRVNLTGQTEASAAMSDSGGGLFQQFAGTWKLAGLLTLANYDTGLYPNGAALYDPATLGTYASYAVRMKDIANKLRYRQWKESHGIALAASTEDDSDADGIGLLEEYAFGSDPASGSPAVAPRAGIEGTDATLTYQIERTRTDLIIAVQESADLIGWTAANVTSTATLSDSGTIRTLKVKVPMGGAEKKFLRLHITSLTN